MLFSLPVVIFLLRKSQDIRPRAFEGKANLLLNTSQENVSAGDYFDVLVSLEIVDNDLAVSGVDFVLLYEKEKLEVYTITPYFDPQDVNSAFTDAPIVNWGENYPENEESGFQFLRVSLVNRKADNLLHPLDGASQVVNLATVRFRAKTDGDAKIKFPDNNKYLEIVSNKKGDDCENLTQR